MKATRFARSAYQTVIASLAATASITVLSTLAAPAAQAAVTTTASAAASSTASSSADNEVAGQSRFGPSSEYGYTTISNYDPNPAGYGTQYTGQPGTPYYFDPDTRAQQGGLDYAYGYLDLGPETLSTFESLGLHSWNQHNNPDNYPALLHTADSADPGAGYWVARYDASKRADNKYRTTKTRELSWTYQARGAWCFDEFDEVRWDPFNQRYACLPNVEYLTAMYPNFPAEQAKCHAANDRTEPLRVGGTTDSFSCTPCYYAPFYDGTDPAFDGTSDGRACGVSGHGLVALNKISNAYAMGLGSPRCMPDEPKGTSPEQSDYAGNVAYMCDYQFYDWANDPNHPEGGYFPPAGSDNQGGYTDETSVDSTKTGTGHGQATSTQTASVVRTTVTSRKSYVYQGKTYWGTASADVVITRTKTTTERADAHEQATATGYGRCTRSTMEAAHTCALKQAQAQADSLAQRAADQQSLEVANARAQDEAQRSALRKATEAARAASITSARKKAQKAADRDALAAAKAKAMAAN